MKVELRILETKYKKELLNSVELLNKSQSDFTFEVSKTKLSFEDEKMNTIIVYSKLETEEKEHDGLVIAITDKYLVGREYYNLFGDINLDVKNHPNGYCILTTYEVKELLDFPIIELYFMYFTLRYTAMFASNIYLSHHEEYKHFCMFDFMIEKNHINQIIKTGNICLDCQIKMDDYLSLDKIFSLNKIARIIGRIARSLNPRQLFNDYLSLIQESSSEITSIESTIAKLSKFQKLENTDKLKQQKLENLIIDGELEETFRFLLIEFQKNQQEDKRKETIILFSKSNSLENDKRLGLITYEEAAVIKSRLIKSTLSLIENIP